MSETTDWLVGTKGISTNQIMAVLYIVIGLFFQAFISNGRLTCMNRKVRIWIVLLLIIILKKTINLQKNKKITRLIQ